MTKKMLAATGKFMVTGRANLSLHGPLPADHPFYANVGRVASEWSHLEHTLDLIIWDLSSLAPSLAACITSQIMGVGPRCKVILSLGKAKGLKDTTIKPFRKLMSDSYAVADLRARIVHDPWYAELNTNQPSQFKSMSYSDQRFGFHDVTQVDIDKTIAAIRNLQECAAKLRSTVLDALSASQQTPS